MQGWFNIQKLIYPSHQQTKEEIPYDHIERCRKSIRQNQTHIHDKNSQQISTRGELTQLDKEYI